MNGMTVPPELERAADEVIASGGYATPDDALRAAAILLREREAERLAFVAMLDDAMAEGRLEGFFEIEQVEAEMNELIEAANHRRI